MPRVPRATRAKAAAQARTIALLLLLDAETAEEEELALLLLIQARQERRRCSAKFGPRGPYNARRSQDFFEVLFEHSSERIFSSWIRMSRAGFWYLHDLIAGNPIFQAQGWRPQTPVKYQLAVFLMRNGGEQTIHAACAISVSEGSAYNFQDRVVHALLQLRDRYVRWPTGERREVIKDAFARAHFPGCLGIIDGSLIRLRDKPLVKPWAYWCRNKYYSLVIQAVCDHRRRFISYDLGWPGSVPDVSLLKCSHLWMHQRRYFELDEYLLADKGYPLTPHFIRPFGDHEMTLDDAPRRKRFNFTLSTIRIEVEHAFGLLKGRFPILRMLPGHDMHRLYRLIESLLVIHNIMSEFGDDAQDLPHFDGGNHERAEEQVADANAVPVPAARRALLMGTHRRKILLDLMS